MNTCLECDKSTKNKKFCSRSCAATFNNKIVIKRIKSIKKCLTCNKIIETYNKYCSNECMKPVQKISKKCLRCTEFVKQSRNIFCSTDCSNKFKSEKRALKEKYFAGQNFAKYQQARRYNLSYAELEKLYSYNNGICIICNKTKATVVDHCHISGKVRGVICTSCNSGLGFFKDDINSLKRAMIYLNKP